MGVKHHPPNPDDEDDLCEDCIRPFLATRLFWMAVAILALIMVVFLDAAITMLCCCTDLAFLRYRREYSGSSRWLSHIN
jgi:hypothetical protein